MTTSLISLTLGCSPRRLVAIAIQRGWCWVRPAMDEPDRAKMTAEEVRLKRIKVTQDWQARNIARGLTAHGTKRKFQRHPEFSGLSKKEYRLEYQRAARSKRKAALTMGRMRAA